MLSWGSQSLGMVWRVLSRAHCVLTRCSSPFGKLKWVLLLNGTPGFSDVSSPHKEALLFWFSALLLAKGRWNLTSWCQGLLVPCHSIPNCHLQPSESQWEWAALQDHGCGEPEFVHPVRFLLITKKLICLLLVLNVREKMHENLSV